MTKLARIVLSIAIAAVLSAPARSGERNLFHMQAWKGDTDRGCDVTLFLYNSAAKTIEAFAGDVTFHSRSGEQLGVAPFVIKYADPGKGVVDRIELDQRACNGLAAVRLRSVSVCKIGGQLYKDCLDYVQVSADRRNLLLPPSPSK